MDGPEWDRCSWGWCFDMKLRAIWTIGRIAAPVAGMLRWVVDGYAQGFRYIGSNLYGGFTMSDSDRPPQVLP
jgi:hypothetical protein